MKKIFFIFIILALIAPVFANAALDLEQTYPSFGEGTEEIAITGTTPLSGIIRYYTTWAIIIAVIVVIISLIIGGAQYLTSGGKPQAMTEARTRIVKAFLGLAILTSAYMILRVINPQINVLQIKKIPVTSGVIALTKCGIDGYSLAIASDTCDESMDGKGLAFGTSIEDLIELNQARYLPSTMYDLTGVLGRLVATEISGNLIQKVHFEDIPFYALGFWGDDSENIEVAFYADKNLVAQSPFLYTHNGQIDGFTRELMPGKESYSIANVVIVDIQDTFALSEVEVTNTESDPPKTEDVTIKHPPLSMTMQGIGPGIYLYSDDDIEKQVFFSEDVSDLSIKDFDDKAEKIEIKNVNPYDETAEKHNYLAVLFDDPGHKGAFRIFFQKSSDQFANKIYFAGAATDFNSDVNIQEKSQFATIDLKALQVIPALYKNNRYVKYDVSYVIGNVPESKLDSPLVGRVDVDTIDHLGRVSGVSSAKVFELNQKSACKEVRLCNQPFGEGKCISYTDDGKLPQGVKDSFNLPMPWYLPVNLPVVMRGIVQDKNDNEYKELIPLTDAYGEDGNTLMQELMFKRNIRSIIIKGDCLVALFKNPITNLSDCNSYDPNRTKNCWKKNTPGSNSDVFTKGSSYIKDLTKHSINLCSAREMGRLDIGKVAPCAAAIAVFPIK